MDWPEGFMWGTGASATQCEGASPASDWWDWERAGHAPPSGQGNGFAERFAEDFRLLASLGLRHHRLTIDWARVEPEPGRHDPAAVAHYRDVLTAALEAGIEPWVCLHHFTLPRWFADVGGFLAEPNRGEFWARHVEFIAETFGDLARGWQPVNETNYYAFAAYLGRGWPPGHNDMSECAQVSRAMQLATAEAAARLRQTGAPVASIFGLSAIEALDDDPRTTRLASLLEALNWQAGLGLFTEGVLRVPGLEATVRPDLAGSFDLIGFSFYSTTGIRQGGMVRYPPAAPVSPLGYGIWADGLGRVLDRLDQLLPGTPLLVAEYGIGTSDDGQRVAYLERGLQVTSDAIARGIDVRGFFHWTGVDNYEWLHGFDVQFGLIDRDRNVRPSALVLQREAGAAGRSASG
ncbi:MAG TPA: family 1 glycosylhydrolase [Streptosporangiaceae bacterium]|nr:family 1 glycosylhydrolase [Streptosporangiaceae bacterium]